jgi:hypothetical protein
VFTSADLILALQRRVRRSIRPLAPGTFPPGWQTWFDAMKARAGHVTGATKEAFIAIFAAREPVFATGYERLNTLQALFRLLRHPVDRDDRRTRIAAMTLTLLFHLFWVVSMAWLMTLRFGMLMAEEEAGRGEESAIQVEFIGEGTPDEDAGGAPPEVAPEIEVAASPAPAASTPSAAAAAAPPLPEPAQAPPQPRPAEPSPPADQPLQVTETTEPDSDFVVPPVRVEIDSRPRVSLAEPVLVQPEAREIVVPQVPTTLRPLPQREIAIPETPTPQLEAVQREVPSPPVQVAIRPIAGPQVPAPDLSRTTPSVGTRDIPMPAAAQAATAGSGQAPSGAAQSTGTRSAGAPLPGSGEGTRPSGTASGSGLAPAPGTGALPTPRRGDDWGDSTRNQPGGSSGLFNADGSPRLAGNPGRVGGGLPPGTITEDYEKVDRMGTWLKRPPIDYQPTSLDRFWIPHENLLEEWVRRGIRAVEIPIPGTSKRISCMVSLLQLGGGCGITDPNMLDIEAEARPPPDIPFKPELHEDQDSLHRPAPNDSPG